MHNPTDPVSYPVTLILFKLHFLCPCSISQMLMILNATGSEETYLQN